MWRESARRWPHHDRPTPSDSGELIPASCSARRCTVRAWTHLPSWMSWIAGCRRGRWSLPPSLCRRCPSCTSPTGSPPARPCRGRLAGAASDPAPHVPAGADRPCRERCGATAGFAANDVSGTIATHVARPVVVRSPPGHPGGRRGRSRRRYVRARLGGTRWHAGRRERRRRHPSRPLRPSPAGARHLSGHDRLAVRSHHVAVRSGGPRRASRTDRRDLARASSPAPRTAGPG